MTVQQTAHNMIDQLSDEGLYYIIDIFKDMDDSKWKQPKVIRFDIEDKMDDRKKEAMERIEARRKKYSGIQTIDYGDALMASVKEKYGV